MLFRSTYYNQTIIMPFWGPPQYMRKEGGTNTGPWTFITTENASSSTVGYATSAGSATNATSAGYATNAGSATNAGYASNASAATNAGYATNAGNASTVSTIGATQVTNLYSPNGASVVNPDTTSAMPSTGQSLICTLGSGPSGNDGHILAMSWANTTSVYGAQLWLDTDPTNRMALRSRSSGGVWNSWSEVITDLNIGSQSVASASSATNAGYATSAGSATNAGYATSAGSAGSATNAGYATLAATANALTSGNNYSVNQLTNNTWYNYNDNDRNAGSATYYPNASTRAFRLAFVTAGSVGTGGNYAGLMQFNPWDGNTSSTGDASYQMAWGSTGTNGSGTPQLQIGRAHV